MKKLLFALAASCVAFPGAAIAAPVYLSCTFDNGTDPIKLTLDEQAGSASVMIPSNGNSSTMDAAFGADKVLFRNDQVRYEIDRVTLAIVRSVPRFRFVDRGHCVVVKTPKRAI